ncbi:hypothetical protein GCM10009827_097000 [Dactylosporangium maewongense]|uniref:Uncharacterized protein n=1 Tax=Dactylosporangium maewongense TaxID=634393 RepID=A0ABN2CMW8_9ACTN
MPLIGGRYRLCDRCLSNGPQERPSSHHVAQLPREALAEHGAAPDPDTADVSVPTTVPRTAPSRLHRRYEPVATPRPVPWALSAGRRRWRPNRRTVATVIAVLATDRADTA